MEAPRTVIGGKLRLKGAPKPASATRPSVKPSLPVTTTKAASSSTTASTTSHAPISQSKRPSEPLADRITQLFHPKASDRPDEQTQKILTQLKTSESLVAEAEEILADQFLTSSEKRHRIARLAREKEDVAKRGVQTFRDRVEAFNTKLATLTEHNDIPRVSAAGNG